MSSHHIIRDKQEPALLIMQLDEFSSENLGQLLEWSPTVLVNGNIYEEADSLGIKIDAVITADPDFIAQANTKIILCEDDELSAGLKYLTGEGYPAVNVISNEFAIKDYVFFVDLINLVIYSGGQKIYAVQSGFSKWLVADQVVVIYNDAINLQHVGLENLSDKHYRTVKDGFCILTFDQPYIFIGETL